MARDHGFHPIRIARIVQETPDTRTFVLDTPFPYQAGQFVTVRANGQLRSYSLSSAPETDDEVAFTVKRVPDGRVSGWLHERPRPGDALEITGAAGSFRLRADARGPLVAFAGGSGITPVFSLVKSALAATEREVRVLSAHRDPETAIFRTALDTLAARHPGRFTLRHHFDARDGLVTRPEIRALAEPVEDADFYVCGPGVFMDLVCAELAERGVAEERTHVERFTPAPGPVPAAGNEQPVEAADPGGVTVVLRGQRRTVPRQPGETLLQSARRAGLTPPFSCEAGDCATCMARVTEGEAKMRVNNVLEDDEVAEGYVLTCQSEPVTPHVTVEYED